MRDICNTVQVPSRSAQGGWVRDFQGIKSTAFRRAAPGCTPRGRVCELDLGLAHLEVRSHHGITGSPLRPLLRGPAAQQAVCISATALQCLLHCITSPSFTVIQVGTTNDDDSSSEA